MSAPPPSNLLPPPSSSSFLHPSALSPYPYRPSPAETPASPRASDDKHGRRDHNDCHPPPPAAAATADDGYSSDDYSSDDSSGLGSNHDPEPDNQIVVLDFCNLPEMLARDLEISSATFEARNLSAGPPTACLAAEAMERRRQERAAPPGLALLVSRSCSPLRGKDRRLGRTDAEPADAAASPMVSRHQTPHTRVPGPDDESDSGSESGLSSGMGGMEMDGEPPYAQQPLTSATSLTSVRCSPGDSGSRPTPPSPHRSIWIENDSDEEDHQQHQQKPPPPPPKQQHEPAEKEGHHGRGAVASSHRSGSRPGSRHSGPAGSLRKRPSSINISVANGGSAAPSLSRMSFTNPFDGNARIPAARSSRPGSRMGSRPPSRGPSAHARKPSQPEIDAMVPKRRSSLNHRVASAEALSRKHDQQQQQHTGVALHDGESEVLMSPVASCTPSILTPSIFTPSIMTPSTADFPRRGLHPPPPPRDACFPRRDLIWPAAMEAPKVPLPPLPALPPLPPLPMSPPRTSRSLMHLRPATPSVNIQTWLDSSVPLHANDGPDEYPSLRGAVPLPPDVLDSLRVTTACFPDTMLLTDSLAIETIRSYSRKFKRPAHERGGGGGGTPRSVPFIAVATSQTLPLSAGTTATAATFRRWPWTRVLSSSASSVMTRKTMQSRALSPDPTGHLAEPVVASPPSPPPSSNDRPPWMTLKNVFGPNVSEYLCNGLYAHVVAYNYISAVCARISPPPPPRPLLHSASRSTVSRRQGWSRRSPQPPRSISGTDTDADRDGDDDDDDDCDDDSLLDPEPEAVVRSNEIPRKAASLLGLSDSYAQEQQTQFLSRMSMRLGERKSSVAVLREALMNGGVGGYRTGEREAAAAAVTEGTCRSLHVSLGRCIARLVATLRSAASEEDGLRDGPVVDEVGEVDALFMRSLCEIVRCTEDTLG